MGLHADPGRAQERRPSRGPLDHSADPESGGPAAGPAAPDLVADVSPNAHWGAIAGADFFTTEVWTWRGLVTYYTVFVIDLASRRVQILGSTPHPEALFMQQIVRTLTMAEGGAVHAPQVLICDRDRKWSA